jgi:DNA-binding XRE family transcriptional regulator
MAAQTVSLAGRTFVIVEKAEYDRLRRRAGVAEAEGPALPAADEEGNVPAAAFARASLARKIIRQRRAAGLSQVQLARRARIRPETLNRIERGKVAPAIRTVERIVRALEAAEADGPDRL